jgi:glycosyltransferase involved in cell wall biosynthesis
MSASDDPLVSVIIPTYNRSGTIGRAITSVLNQTYNNFELIIIDDNSGDDTEKIVQSFDDPRLRYIKHDTNRGGGAARNTGIRVAEGEYIAFQDSDDEWMPQKLSMQLPGFQGKRDNGVVFSRMMRIYEDHHTVFPSQVEYSSDEFHKAMFWINYVGTPTAVVRKELLDRIEGFDERLPRLQDWDLFIRLSAITSFHFVPEPLVKVYIQDNSLTTNADYLAQSIDIFCNKYHSLISGFSSDTQSKIYYKYGSMLMKEGMIAKGRKFLKLAFQKDWFNLKNNAEYLLSLLGPKLYRLARK